MELNGLKPGPHTIKPCLGGRSLASYLAASHDTLANILLEHGAILLRGFDVNTPADFQAAIDSLDARPMNYTFRSTPRTNICRTILTATEYPKQLEIPLHSENAYQRAWPLWIALCCIAPAATGGQTTLANLAEVTKNLGESTVERFARMGVRYVRTYNPYVDLQWPEVFQTSDRADVSRICAERGIECIWLDDKTLQTTHICQGVAQHPSTGQTVFFNQAHLFHPSSLGEKAVLDLVKYFGRDRLPRNAQYGDGSEIDPEELEHIRRTFSDAAIDLQWQAGDVLLLDNMQFAHGRRAFGGQRKVLAALLNEYNSA